MDNLELVEQGAEARVYKMTYLGRPAILKERFRKKYRQPELDEHILKERIKAEARGLLRSRITGLRVPAVYFVDLETGKLCMEFVEGVTAKKYIDNQIKESGLENNCSLLMAMNLVGEGIGRLHSDNLIHGDLTTSNIIVQNLDPIEIYFIDFGLSFVSTSAEDKGVDLYVLERALKSTHVSAEELFEQIMASYKHSNKLGSKEVINKFEEVKARGRKRTMVG